jgi:peroxiredoxin family protein
VTPGANCRPQIPGKEAGTTMVVFSNDLDRALAAFIIANGSAAMGMPVTMFFTFWGLNILRRDNAVPVRKTLLERMFGFMMPRGSRKLILSKMHMAGMGTAMMKGIMKSKRVSTLPELIEMAQKAGVRMVACSMSMDVMGIHREELVDGIEVAGVADYLGSASGSSTNLFI